jgi:3D (Asp-Asp-Asp) domain-containing protein
MKKDIKITRGKTFELVLLWQQRPFVYKPITGIVLAGSPVLEVVGHGIPDGWPVVISGVEGCTNINVKDSSKISPRDYRIATYVDDDHIELNEVNTTAFDPYLAGGYAQYLTPVDLTGYTARMKIKDAYGGTTLLSLTTENFMIVVDVSANKTRVVIPAVDTEVLTLGTWVYDMEMVSPDTEPVVTEALYGRVVVEDEVTV